MMADSEEFREAGQAGIAGFVTDGGFAVGEEVGRSGGDSR